MFQTYVLMFSVLSALAMGQPPTARAADSCQPVFDALKKGATTPNHSFTTLTSGGAKSESETIFANGQKYIRTHGNWMRIPVTSQDALEQEKEMEEKGKSACQLLRREAVNGEAATVYSMRREYEEIKEDAQLWISNSSGLVLRVEEDLDNAGNQKKGHQSTRFEYNNIRPPM